MYRAPTRAKKRISRCARNENSFLGDLGRRSVDFLLFGEGFHGGDAGGALRGEEAGGEADNSHYARGAGEDGEVERLHVEEDGVHGAAGLPCAEQA